MEINWLMVDPMLGLALDGAAHGFASAPAAVAHRGESSWRVWECHAQDLYPNCEWFIEHSARHTSILNRHLLGKLDAVIISSFAPFAPRYGIDGKPFNWGVTNGLSHIYNNFCYWVPFKPRVMVGEIPYKLARLDNEKNVGAREFREMLQENIEAKGYSSTYFLTQPWMHGNPDKVYRLFLILWRSDFSPVLEQQKFLPTPTFESFFMKDTYFSQKVTGYFHNPYVVYFREKLNVNPASTVLANVNLMDELVARGKTQDFLDWVNDWATTDADKQFAREVDQFVHGHNPYNNAPHTFKCVTDHTTPNQFQNLLHPYANRWCTDKEKMALVGWPEFARSGFGPHGPGFFDANLLDTFGRAPKKTWTAITRMIAEVLDDNKPTPESDTRMYFYDNVYGSRFILDPPKRRGKRSSK